LDKYLAEEPIHAFHIRAQQIVADDKRFGLFKAEDNEYLKDLNRRLHLQILDKNRPNSHNVTFDELRDQTLTRSAQMQRRNVAGVEALSRPDSGRSGFSQNLAALTSLADTDPNAAYDRFEKIIGPKYADLLSTNPKSRSIKKRNKGMFFGQSVGKYKEELKAAHKSLAAARAEPGRLTYGSGGVGSSNHLSGALFALAANLDLTHVSYRGAAPAMTALYAGEIDMVFASTVETLPHVQGGRARLLGVAGPRRLAALPDTPAINEIVPGYIALNWYAIAAPRATPPAIIARMAETLGSIRDLPDVRARFAAAGTTPLLTGPAELAALLESDVPQWQRVVAATGIKVE
jgi:hypothetical protein